MRKCTENEPNLGVFLVSMSERHQTPTQVVFMVAIPVDHKKMNLVQLRGTGEADYIHPILFQLNPSRLRQVGLNMIVLGVIVAS
jgi:hypothetical protein